MSTVARIPLDDRLCSMCSYFTKRGSVPYCMKFGIRLFTSWAKMGCLSFTVEKQIRITGRIDDPPEGRNINEETYTYNANSDFDVVTYFQDSLKLFSLKYTYDGSKRLTKKKRTNYKVAEYE